jgi:RND family efflux transporter MFP subunit
MQRKLKHLFIGVIILAIGFGGYYSFRSKPEQTAQKPRNAAQTVLTARAERKSIPITVTANGFVTAIDTVEVRPQVQNVVRSVHVREGQEVKAGQLLFTLDERSDQSGLARAQAEAASARAELAEAEQALKRNQELVEKKFVSQAVVDSARSKVEALRSTVRAGEASAKSSAIALGNNRITASIGGRIGIINVHPGSLAQPSGDPMLTISRLDPIAITFSIPERELSNIRATYPQGGAPVTALLAGSREAQGKLIFIDNAADPQSGTIRMKAEFPNKEQTLWPGTYVNVRLVSRTVPDAVTVPTQAVVTGPEEKFVYLVQQDDTVKQQKVNVIAIENGMAALSGVEAGARVVVEGAQNLRPGGKVKEAPSPQALAGTKQEATATK